MSVISVCQQCFRDYKVSGHNDGFCSDYCLREYDRQLWDDEEEDGNACDEEE